MAWSKPNPNGSITPRWVRPNLTNLFRGRNHLIFLSNAPEKHHWVLQLLAKSTCHINLPTSSVLVLTSSEPCVDVLTSPDMTLITVLCKYPNVRLARYDCRIPNRAMHRVTILSAWETSSRVLITASIMLSSALEHGTLDSYSIYSFFRRSLRETTSTLNIKWPNDQS